MASGNHGNPPNRHCARRPSSRALFPAPLPRRRGGPGSTRIAGYRTNRYPPLGCGKRLRRRGGEWPRSRPSPPLEVATAGSASGMGRHFPQLWQCKWVARRRLAAISHLPTEIAGAPRRLTGPRRMDRGIRMTLPPPALYVPRRLGIGFLEMAREIGDPQRIYRPERGPRGARAVGRGGAYP